MSISALPRRLLEHGLWPRSRHELVKVVGTLLLNPRLVELYPWLRSRHGVVMLVIPLPQPRQGPGKQD